MSKDFEKKIEELFLHKEKIIDSNILESIIKQSLKNVSEAKSIQPISDVPQVSDSEIFKLLPKFEFREAQVGALSGEIKNEFMSFFSKAFENLSTLEDRVKYLENFTSNKQANTTEEILSNLMILKILENIIRQSSYGAAGFQIEAFLAGMFATGQQIRTDVQSKAVDIVIDKIEYQVKLADVQSTITMRVSTLQKYFGVAEVVMDSKVNQNIVLNFIIIEKVGVEAIRIYAYEYTYANFKEDLLKLKARVAAKLANNPKAKIQDESITIRKEKYRKKLLGQIEIKKEVFDFYSNLLEGNIKIVLSNVAKLINNVNKFYIKNDPSAAKDGRDTAFYIHKNLK